ncbi:hypothetical protein Hanom_Chr07g00600291 [Helianthus anomalus]
MLWTDKSGKRRRIANSYETSETSSAPPRRKNPMRSQWEASKNKYLVFVGSVLFIHEGKQ